MRPILVLHYDAFSSVMNKGNPAGIVLECDGLTEDDMQLAAKKVGFNETVFALKSEAADLKLKYYTPGHEIHLCGHATIGALFCLKTRGYLQDKEFIQIETNVGILPVYFETKSEQLFVTMKQDEPRFIPFQGDVDKLAESIGLTSGDIDTSIPIVYGSTGAWTLLIPVKELRSFTQMKPRNELFPAILTQNPRASLHPFCFETYDKTAMMHARHFSSPYSGTVEDAVTGTASGVMGAYYLEYIDRQMPSIEFTVEQGQEIHKDGRVFVNVERNADHMDIYISGTGVFVKEFEVVV